MNNNPNPIDAQDLYSLLQLSPEANSEAVDNAFCREIKQLALPDTARPIDPMRLQAVARAYLTLSQPEGRTTYDRENGIPNLPWAVPHRKLESTSVLSRIRALFSRCGTRSTFSDIDATPEEKAAASRSQRSLSGSLARFLTGAGRVQRLFRLHLSAEEAEKGAIRELSINKGEHDSKHLRLKIGAGVSDGTMMQFDTEEFRCAVYIAVGSSKPRKSLR